MSKIQKKISVPCEILLQREKVHKQKSRVFTRKIEAIDSNCEYEQNEQLKGKFDSVIKSNIFSPKPAFIYGGESQLINKPLSVSKINENHSMKKEHCNILTELLNEIENSKETKQPQSQPTLTKIQTLLKSKTTKMDYTQRFQSDKCEGEYGINFFRMKRSKI